MTNLTTRVVRVAAVTLNLFLLATIIFGLIQLEGRGQVRPTKILAGELIRGAGQALAVIAIIWAPKRLRSN